MWTSANAAASIVTVRKGALRMMPGIEEVNDLIFSSYIDSKSMKKVEEGGRT